MYYPKSRTDYEWKPVELVRGFRILEVIKDWVSINHGGYEWGAFEQNQLLTDESRQAFVGTMITNMVEEW